MRTLIAGVIAVAVLAAGIVWISEETQAGGTTVDLTAIDLNPAGNTCNTVGTVESSLGNVPLNTPTTFDIVIQGVPPGPDGVTPDGGGLYGFGVDLIFDPAIIDITGATGGGGNVLQLCPGPGVPLEVTDADRAPNLFRIDFVDLSGNEESGSGRLATVTFTCVGTGVGTITMSDTDIAGGNQLAPMGDSGAVVYTADAETEATIGCNTGVGPTPTQPPTGTPTPTPSPTPVGQTPTPTPTPSPTPSPTPIGQTPSPTPSPTPIGQTPTPTPTPGPETPTPTAPPGTQRVWGDTNCSGSVEPVDALVNLRHDANLSVNQPAGCPEPEEAVLVDGNELAWGDTDCDGSVGPIDALRVLRHDAGLNVDPVFPCPDVGQTVTVQDA